MKKINNICIIDDNTITVFGIKKMLNSIVDCKSISHYENGEDAFINLEKIYTTKNLLPDIIFLDLNMPVMDGWAFLDAFIALNIKQPLDIQIITSSISPQDYKKFTEQKAITHHNLCYNSKPLDKAKINPSYNIDPIKQIMVAMRLQIVKKNIKNQIFF